MTTTIDRLNTLTRESVETAFDAAHATQRQNAQLLESWLGVVETGQKTARDLTLKALQQAQQARSLWLELIQETFDTGVDTATAFAQNGLRETSETVNRTQRQAKTAEAR